jgi:hypothetical protein
MFRPIPIKFVRHDIVELKIKDRYFDCAYAGQTGSVSCVNLDGTLNIVLKCGHLFSCDKKCVRKIGHKEPETILRRK